MPAWFPTSTMPEYISPRWWGYFVDYCYWKGKAPITQTSKQALVAGMAWAGSAYKGYGLH